MGKAKKNQSYMQAQQKLIRSIELTSEVLQLIKKYAGGRIPILVDDKDTKKGLVNGELLQIYQCGFTGANLIPLGILLARNNNSDKAMKWEKEYADYHLNEWAKDGWTNVCKAIRACKDADEACELCDRRRAQEAEEAGDVVAYMCVHGMVDFAMPIFVEDEVVAVIFTGQRIPKDGTLWNPEFVEEKGLFSSEGSGQTGVYAREEAIARFDEAEKKYGFGHGMLLAKLKEDINRNSRVEVSPEDVEGIRETLHKAGKHLSNLARQTYSLEKSKAVGGLRSLVARSVA